MERGIYTPKAALIIDQIEGVFCRTSGRARKLGVPLPKETVLVKFPQHFDRASLFVLSVLKRTQQRPVSNHFVPRSVESKGELATNAESGSERKGGGSERFDGGSKMFRTKGRA